VSPRYEFAISGEASRFLFGSSDRIRRRAEVAFEFLAKHPFSSGDFTETTPDGRVLQVKLFDNMIVTFWVDHGVREVRVIRCEVVD
jgi:hypothetical protein